MRAFRYRIRPNLYRDSVALMRLSAGLQDRPGVEQVVCMMATPANRAALAGELPLPAETRLRPDDLLLAVAGPDEALLDGALDWAEAELHHGAGAAVVRPEIPQPHSLAEGVRLVPGANLALISVPGDYAYAEALKALRLGLHVFLFSSGVSLDDEVRLKRLAEQRRRLLMGPDCGTALLGGVPLGFANVVRSGSIGLVGAAGTGLQEVMCLIHNWGGGVSQAIGTGGRDLCAEVGGLTMRAGLQLLQYDPATAVIVLVAKAPHPRVAAEVLQAASSPTKPVIAAFLGLEPTHEAGRVRIVDTLEAAAREALVAAGGRVPDLPTAPSAAPVAGRRWLRGLFSGGSLCTEAVLILRETLGGVALPGPDEASPRGHSCRDLGDAAYTVGRPHPMLDGRLRAEKVRQAATEADTAVVLFDVVLGYGACPDPSEPLLAVIRTAHPQVRFVAHVCGTEADPQDLSAQVEALCRAGVQVMPTNASAARLAANYVVG